MLSCFYYFTNTYIRYIKEIDTQGKTLIPPPIYNKVGDISYLRPEVIEGIKKKFQIKKNELIALRG